ncbi:MAG: hypothetical protein AAF432_12870 [Planctomycetota bacterium]
MQPARAQDDATPHDSRGSLITDLRAGELGPVILAALCFFCLLCCYSIMRPVRDAFAAEGVDDIHWWFTGTLVASTIIVPIFWALVSVFSRRMFLTIIFALFVGIILTFALLIALVPGSGVVRFAFYAWLSMFVLFILSVFWGIAADVFAYETSRRVYGYIGVGGTLGSIAGSFATSALVQPFGDIAVRFGYTAEQGRIGLLLLAAVLLIIGGAIAVTLLSHVRPDAEDSTGGTSSKPKTGFWDGLKAITASPYLLGIMLYIVGLTMTATVFYKAQLLIAGELSDEIKQTIFFANIWMSIQVTALVVQLLFTGKIMRWLGIGFALAVLPVITVGSLLWLAIASTDVSIVPFRAMLPFTPTGGLLWVTTMPMVLVITLVEVARKASNYSIAKPARESLFTVVSPAEKYQSKSFIDTFVYRGSDQVAIWLLVPFVSVSTASLTWMSVIFVPFCLAWASLGVWLGRKQKRIANADAAVKSTA